MPSLPFTPLPSLAPPLEVIVPATESVEPAAVNVMLPALPPPLFELAAAAVPEVTMFPTVKLPSVPLPVVVRSTAPPAVLAELLWVSMVNPLEVILGALMVTAAPPVVIPVGFTLPIARASLLVKLTAPVASEAKVPTSLIGVPELALFNVYAPVPDNPNLVEITAPVWVTALPAVSTVLPAVSMLVMDNPLLSVK